MAISANKVVLRVFYNDKNNSTTFYLTCDHILALNLVFISK